MLRRPPRLAAPVCALLLSAALPVAAQPTEGESSGSGDDSKSSDEAAAEKLPGLYESFAAAPLFLPRSYLYGATSSGGRAHRQRLVFGLQYAFHLPLYNGVRAAAAAGRDWSGAVHLSFAGALRMLRANSHPIRMPSYRPSLSGQVFRIRHGPLPVIWGLKLELSHHSNGQDRCLVDAFLADETPECTERIVAVVDPADELNRVSGSFANNAVGLGFDARLHFTDARGIAVSHLAGGIDLAVSLPSHAGLRELYGAGWLQTHVEYQHGFAHAFLRGSVDLRHDFRARTDVPSTAGWVTLVAQPQAFTGFGFFVRYFGGRDFYNAFFVDRIHQFSAGLSWNAERPLRFALPAH